MMSLHSGHSSARRRRSIPGSAVLSLLLTATPVRCENWPQFRGPRRDGRSSETGLLKSWPADGPELIWSAADLGKGYAQPVVVDRRVYVTGMVEKTGYVFALDTEGNLAWRRPYGREWTKSYRGSRCTPTVHEGAVYVVSSLGELVCMDAGTGEERWRLNVLETFKGGTGRFGFVESLLVHGRKVICTAGGADAALVALDTGTGATIWRTAGLNDKAAYCSPLLIEQGPRQLIVTMTSHNVIGVRADSGELLWQHPCHNPYGQNPNTPVHADGMLFCTSGDRMGSFLLKLSADGTMADHQWSQPTLDCHYGNVVRIGGYVYASAHQNSDGWVCLALSDGKVMYETKDVKKGSACYADGMLYCYSVDGSVSLVRASPEGFEVVGSFDVQAGSGEHFAQPVISGGRLYIRHGEALMVYGVGGGRDKPDLAPQSRK